MKSSTAIVLLSLASWTARAQIAPFEAISVQSMSGQFTIVAPRVITASAMASKLAKNPKCISLDPNLLAVSCERVKDAIWQQLGVTGPWQGKIHVALHAVRNADEPITIVSQRFSDGWRYRIEMADVVERLHYVRALANVVVLEVANRHAGRRCAEIPVWLTEGLTQHLMSSPSFELTPPEPRYQLNGVTVTPTLYDARWKDPLDSARGVLHEHPPLTLQKLSWPTEAQLTGEAGSAYRSSAQLFVAKLLKLPDGPLCMNAMLDALPDYYNWQTAFLKAFHQHFPRQLDLEQWWALQVVHFTGRDPSRLWTLERSWNKLDEILQTAVQVRQDRKDLPTRQEAALPGIIRYVDFNRQPALLKQKMHDLDLLRLNAAPDIAELAADYYKVLASYLRSRDQQGWPLPTARGARLSSSAAVRDALQSLDRLESRRQALRPKPEAAAVNDTHPQVADGK